jgi:hypothetical protein
VDKITIARREGRNGIIRLFIIHAKCIKDVALECANDSNWEWDLKTVELFTSDKVYDICGYLLDKDVDIVSFMKDKVHPEDIDRVFVDFKDHLNNATNDEYVWLLAIGMLVTE